MKNFKTLSVAAFAALMAACGPSKSTTAETSTTQRGRSNTEVTARANSNGEQSSIGRATRKQNTTTAESAANRAAAEEARLKSMYAEIAMTDQQVASFEKQWNAQSAAWKRKNPDQEMNAYVRTEYQDRILGNILDEQQFARYRQWAREHAEGRH